MACSSNHGDRSRGGSHTLSFALHEWVLSFNDFIFSFFSALSSSL
jgi:hypothetical protein